MKKFELIKYAYDNYPKETIIEWSKGDTIILNGYYMFDATTAEPDYIVDGNGKCVYDGYKWAEIVQQDLEKPKSILSGKCAIQVNNEREFKLLMEHYESKGFISSERNNPSKFNSEWYNDSIPKTCSYGNYFWMTTNRTGPGNSHTELDFKIIPFSDFAKEIGIEVPVFVMTSEDGIPLYVGDNYHMAKNITATGNKWELCVMNAKIDINSFAVVDPLHCKAFSTKESAESWIYKMNKPKLIKLEFDDLSVNVSLENIYFYPNTIYSNHHISTNELKKIYKAYKSLQS